MTPRKRTPLAEQAITEAVRRLTRIDRGCVETPEFDLCPAAMTAIAKRVELEVDGVRPTPSSLRSAARCRGS